MFNTQSLKSGPLASFDIKVTDEDKAYQIALYDSRRTSIEEYNFLIDRIIPGILQRKFEGKEGATYNVKGIEIRFPQFSTQEGNYLMTPFIARMTGQSYTCDIIIDYVETKQAQQTIVGPDGRKMSNTVFVDNKINSRKVGFFHCLVGSNRDICSIKPDEFNDLDEWKMMLSECPASPGSYVIHNGAEKVVINDEKLRTNIYLTFKTKGESPLIETRITCMDNSRTSLIRLHIGRRRPTVKVLLPHLKKKHYPIYLTLYLLYYAYNNTTTIKTEFLINHFEELISSFTTAENKDSVITYLRPSKEKFFELFSSINKEGKFFINSDKIREYIHGKLGNPKSYNAEEDAKKFVMEIESKTVADELFIQCSFQNKIANLALMTCQTILCACGLREYDSRDDWDKKRSGSIVGLIRQYIADTIVENIKDNTADSGGFDFGKNDRRKESIVEARKCETLNAAYAEKDKITNQVDTRTNSIELREVSESQWPNICPAKTPEGETCGLQKQKSALCHTSYNQEYSPNRKLVINDLFEPYITYFSNKKTNVFRYRFASVDFYGRVFFLHYGTTQETVSPDGIYVSTRILNIFNEVLKEEKATYYIDDDSIIYIRFGQELPIKEYGCKSYMGGAIFAAIPEQFNLQFEEAAKMIRNPDYRYFSHHQRSEECNTILSFKHGKTGKPMNCTVILSENNYTSFYVSTHFIDLLKSINKDSNYEYTPGTDGNPNTFTIVCKDSLERYDYIHWTGVRVACMLPQNINKAFGKLLGVINDYLSTEKSKTYSYTFTFNGIVMIDPTISGYIPKIIWVNGKKLLSYLKTKRRNGELPFDSCAAINNIDYSVQYFDDDGRIMSPMLILNDEGQLIIDKLNSWEKFSNRNFNDHKKLIESLYKEGSMELIDACEMDTTLIALDITECRTIYKLKKFLDSLNLKTLKSVIFKDGEENDKKRIIRFEDEDENIENYYRIGDINNVKVNGNNYEIEFTTIKPDFPSLEFTQDGITYYGTYTFQKKIYNLLNRKVYKLTKPINGRTKDTYYMVYKIINEQGEEEIKFITKDEDLMTDGENVYIHHPNLTHNDHEMDGYLPHQIFYVNFPKDKNDIYVDIELTILDVSHFNKIHSVRMEDHDVMFILNGEVVDPANIVDKHFILKNGKYSILDEVHFPIDVNEGVFETKKVKKVNEYIPESNKNYDSFNLDEDNKKPVDKREADLHMSFVRRHIDDIYTIPDKYLTEHEYDQEEQFQIVCQLNKLVSVFGNKRVMNILRRYIGTGFKFSHCLIDPNAAYSIIANLVPKADSNPGPRFSYQCSMGTQALGVGNCIWYRRFETSNKRLISPVEHSFETIAELPLSQVTMATTQNFVILVAANYKGYEDPIIISKSSLMKFGRYEKEVTIKIIESGNRDFNETVCHPTDSTGNLKTGNEYRHLDQSGLPRLGTFIKVGDYVVGRTKVYNSVDHSRRGVEQKVDSSYKAGVGDEGVVVSVQIIGSEGVPGAFRTIIVKLAQRRSQQVGDKMASRYSQKGTIGDIIGGMINDGDPKLKIVDDHLMPFVCAGPNKGLRAEIIFNPASFPSRMTCGLIKEILCSKAALYLQEKVDASNFHHLDEDYYRDSLYENDFYEEGEHLDINANEILCHSDGEIIMDSTTAKPMKFFIGIVAYQFLRHHVADKETARATGPVKAITHQPNEGRKNRGGQRMGEMERDAILSSGAANTLFDRFMDASDGYEDIYCESCKNNSSISPLKGKVCIICGKAGTLVSVAEPRIYKVFHHQMNALGLEIKNTLRPIDDFQADISKSIKAEVEAVTNEDL